MKKLTILEALCVLKVGCSTSEERELVEIAFDTINDEVRKLRLIHKKDLIEKELENFKTIERPKIGGLSAFSE
jgi:hypothetical protein